MSINSVNLPKPIMVSTYQRCFVHELPVELLLLILYQVSDLETLKNVVHSCRSFHQAYLVDRGGFLRSVLPSDMPSRLLREALGAVRASNVGTAQATTDSLGAQAERFFTTYELEFARWWVYPKLDHVSPDDLRSLARLKTIVTAVEGDFVRWLLEGRPTGDEKTDAETELAAVPLTELESRWICTGLYRMELLCNLFKGQRWRLNRFLNGVEKCEIVCEAWDQLGYEFYIRCGGVGGRLVSCVFDYLYYHYSNFFHDQGIHADERVDRLISLGLVFFRRFTRPGISLSERQALVQENEEFGLPILRRFQTLDHYYGTYSAEHGYQPRSRKCDNVCPHLDFNEDGWVLCSPDRKRDYIRLSSEDPGRRWNCRIWGKKRMARWGLKGGLTAQVGDYEMG